MFQFIWDFNAFPLNFSFFFNLFYLLLLHSLPAILLYSLSFSSLSLFSPLLERVQWSAANKSVFVFYAFVCLHVSDSSTSAPFLIGLTLYRGSGWMHFMRCGVALKDRNAPVSDLKTDASNVAAWLWLMNVQVNRRPCGPANLLFIPLSCPGSRLHWRRVLIKMHKLNNPLAKWGGSLTTQ